MLYPIRRLVQPSVALALMLVSAAPGLAYVAEPPDSLAAGLQRELDGNGTVADEDDAALRQWYGETGFQPLWIGPNGANGKAHDFLVTLRLARREGLVPGDYPIAEIETRMWASPLEVELLLSKALVHYVSDLRTGRLSARTSYPALFIRPGEIDRLAILRAARDAADIGQAVDAYTPANPSYRRLRRILREYRTIALKGGWPLIPEGPSLKPEMRDRRVTVLRRRLMATKDLLYAGGETDLYDEALLQAVERFQKRHGLVVDGIVGRRTLAELNVPVQRRIEQIIVNMERWRWMPNDLGDRYILVNLAGYELEVVEYGAVVMAMRIVTGQPYRRTPVFSGNMTWLEFNPFWTVPPTIAKHDILPKTRQDPNYLANRNIRVYTGWRNDSPEMDPAAIDWNAVDAKRIPFRFRQDPGPGNALGRVKFMFPNRFNVYLHDTPLRELFKKTVRSFSSGCVRAEDSLELAEYLTADLPGWDRKRIEDVIASRKTTVVKLARPLPVHLTYSTVWFGEGGTIHFRDDVYARDDLMYQALFGYPPSRKQVPQDR
jgi:murein L,D-transpeptidase YcbB/YkuD